MGTPAGTRVKSGLAFGVTTMPSTEKLYTTSQAIRILERYPDRGYVFECLGYDTRRYRLRRTGPTIRYICHVLQDNAWFVSATIPANAGWKIVAPKRERGRSVVIGEVYGRTVLDFQNRYGVTYGQSERLPSGGRWRLIAVEVKE